MFLTHHVHCAHQQPPPEWHRCALLTGMISKEMAGIYGMIEVLFVRTAPDQLKEQIMPELQSSPSR